jgi:hypothetical protein
VIIAVAIVSTAITTAFSYAALELGDVDQHKVKYFSNYFSRFYQYPNPQFEDAELKSKVQKEIKDVYIWLKDAPELDSISQAEMAIATAKLFRFFTNAGIAEARDKLIHFYEVAIELNPTSSELHFELIAFRDSNSSADNGDIEVLQDAVVIDPERALKEGYYFRIAERLYNDGRFRMAYETLKQQVGASRYVEDVENLLYVMNQWIDLWGEIPEEIEFVHNPNGTTIPKIKQSSSESI